MSQALRIFGWPLALAALTFVGLMAALWGGEDWRWLSWLGLAAPIAAIGWRLARPRR